MFAACQTCTLSQGAHNVLQHPAADATSFNLAGAQPQPVSEASSAPGSMPGQPALLRVKHGLPHPAPACTPQQWHLAERRCERMAQGEKEGWVSRDVDRLHSIRT
eukprot:358413-Chlamydomonas_euryale.AAC.21